MKGGNLSLFLRRENKFARFINQTHMWDALFILDHDRCVTIKRTDSIKLILNGHFIGAGR